MCVTTIFQHKLKPRRRIEQHLRDSLCIDGIRLLGQIFSHLHSLFFRSVLPYDRRARSLVNLHAEAGSKLMTVVRTPSAFAVFVVIAVIVQISTNIGIEIYLAYALLPRTFRSSSTVSLAPNRRFTPVFISFIKHQVKIIMTLAPRSHSYDVPTKTQLLLQHAISAFRTFT